MTEFNEKRARALHRALWKWMAKNINREKEEWPGWRKDDSLHRRAWANQCCFACAFDSWLMGCCNKCPVVDKTGQCNSNDSLYRRILYCHDQKKSTALCLEMAEAWPPVENN